MTEEDWYCNCGGILVYVGTDPSIGHFYKCQKCHEQQTRAIGHYDNSRDKHDEKMARAKT